MSPLNIPNIRRGITVRCGGQNLQLLITRPEADRTWTATLATFEASPLAAAPGRAPKGRQHMTAAFGDRPGDAALAAIAEMRKYAMLGVTHVALDQLAAFVGTWPLGYPEGITEDTETTSTETDA